MNIHRPIYYYYYCYWLLASIHWLLLRYIEGIGHYENLFVYINLFNAFVFQSTLAKKIDHKRNQCPHSVTLLWTTQKLKPTNESITTVRCSRNETLYKATQCRHSAIKCLYTIRTHAVFISVTMTTTSHIQ